MIHLGQVLPGPGMAYGFGRDCYDSVRVEAMGVDWIVARGVDGVVWFAEISPEVAETLIAGQT